MIDQLRVWQAHLLPGRALDIGAGDGETSQWLATHGFEVDALELEQPRARHLQTLFSAFPIQLHSINVLDFNFAPVKYTVIVASAVLHFIQPNHHRQLAGRIVESLTPGGMLFAAVFTRDDPSMLDTEDPGANRIHHYFDTDELRHLFPQLDVLLYEESRRVAPDSLYGYRAGATLIARRALEPARD
jgi:tellurite methyltransferase